MVKKPGAEFLPTKFKFLADANFSDFAGGSGFLFYALGGKSRRYRRGRDERDTRSGRHSGAGSC